MSGAERRVYKRRVIQKMPGSLYSVLTGDEIECRPIDISEKGLGVFSEFELEDDEKQLILEVKGQKYYLDVIWLIENPGDLVGYRIGLKPSDPSLELESLFQDC